MAKRFFLTALTNIRLAEDVNPEMDLGNGLKITRNIKHVRALISPALAGAMGTLEHGAILRAGAVVYSLEEYQGERANLLNLLNQTLAEVRTITFALWFIKDNAVDFELGFSETPHRKPGARHDSNFLASGVSDCRGGIDVVEFNRDELQNAANLITHLTTVVPWEEPAGGPHRLKRVERAFYLAQAARAQSDLGLKVSFYCICFESLFSTSTTELSHKLAERMCIFLESDPLERKLVYKAVRQAYDLRSTIVHGESFSTKRLKQVEDSAKDCDQLLRRVFVMLAQADDLMDLFNGTNELLEDYLLGLVLGAADRPPGPASHDQV